MRKIYVDSGNMDILHHLVKLSILHLRKQNLVATFNDEPYILLEPKDTLRLRGKYEYLWTGRRLKKI